MDADRAKYIQDNAVAIVDDLESKIATLKSIITRLEASRTGMRLEIKRLNPGFMMAKKLASLPNIENRCGPWKDVNEAVLELITVMKGGG